MASQNCTTNAALLTPRQVTRAVDKLAILRAAIADLEHEAGNLSELLVMQGHGSHHGTRNIFHVGSVVESHLDIDMASAFLSPGVRQACMASEQKTTGMLYAA